METVRSFAFLERFKDKYKLYEKKKKKKSNIAKKMFCRLKMIWIRSTFSFRGFLHRPFPSPQPAMYIFWHPPLQPLDSRSNATQQLVFKGRNRAHSPGFRVANYLPTLLLPLLIFLTWVPYTSLCLLSSCSGLRDVRAPL